MLARGANEWKVREKLHVIDITTNCVCLRFLGSFIVELIEVLIRNSGLPFFEVVVFYFSSG